MIDIFKSAIQRGASDIHVKAGDVIRIRIDGLLQPLTQQRLTPAQVEQICAQLMPEKDRDQLPHLRDYDCSWGVPGVGRFRVNILRQRGTLMTVLRVIPFDIPTFEALRLPPVLARIALAERGMVLVTGVTGSGQEQHPGGAWLATSTRTGRSTSSRWRTRSSSCTATCTARSPSGT